jgi:hypothetical protein
MHCPHLARVKDGGDALFRKEHRNRRFPWCGSGWKYPLHDSDAAGSLDALAGSERSHAALRASFNTCSALIAPLLLATSQPQQRSQRKRDKASNVMW